MKRGRTGGAHADASCSPHRALTLLCLLLLGAGLLSAEDVRDFAGLYMIGEITDLGDQVRVSLTVRVTNYSGADVVAATITLEDSLLPGQSCGTFLRLVIPRREYDQWQSGPTPQLRIEFKNGAGQTVQRMIELDAEQTDGAEIGHVSVTKTCAISTAVAKGVRPN